MCRTRFATATSSRRRGAWVRPTPGTPGTPLQTKDLNSFSSNEIYLTHSKQTRSSLAHIWLEVRRPASHFSRSLQNVAGMVTLRLRCNCFAFNTLQAVN